MLRQQRGLLFLDVGQQRGEGIGEGLDAVGEELVRDLGHADARGFERVQQPLGLRDGWLQRGRGLPVLQEAVQGGGRHGVDGIGRDERLDVEYVAVGGVLGAGAGPQGPLHPRALGLQRLPSVSGGGLLEIAVGEGGVGDSCLAQQVRQLLLARLHTGLKLPVHGDVHAADEEGGDGGHAAQVAAVGREPLQPRNIGLAHLGVGVAVEEQGHVDVDALANEPLDGGDALGGAGDLHHDVGAVQGREEPMGLRDGALGVIGQGWADLQRREAVGAVRGVVDGA